MGRFLLDLEPYDREGPFAQLTGRLLDKHGKRQENLEMPVAVNEIRKGVDVRQAGDAFLKVKNRDRLGDLLWYRTRGNPALSVEVLRALDEANVTIDPEVYRWPLHVVSGLGNTLRREYRILWACKRHPVLDLARADVDFYPGTEVIRKVRRWVFDEDFTPPYDLYATDYYDWIASDRVKQVVEAGRFTGFSFVPVG